jgi:hypothetical protein
MEIAWRLPAVSIQQLLAKQGIPELNHAPYSRDLSPTDFFLLPKMISTLKGRRFEDTEDIKSKKKKKKKKRNCWH